MGLEALTEKVTDLDKEVAVLIATLDISQKQIMTKLGEHDVKLASISDTISSLKTERHDRDEEEGRGWDRFYKKNKGHIATGGTATIVVAVLEAARWLFSGTK